VLAPVVAIMAFAVLPAMAQASQPVVQVNGAGAAGQQIKAQSGTLETQANGVIIACEHSELNFVMTSNEQGIVEGGQFSGGGNADHPSACATNVGLNADITTNASANNPWIVHFYAEDEGNVQAQGGNPGTISFTAQLQTTGQVSVATCTFTAPEVPFTYTQSPEDLQITVAPETAFFEEVCGGEPAGEGELHGDFTTSSVGGQVTVD